jgi:hypothetical protein
MKQEELEVLKLLEKGEISAQEAAARMSETWDSNLVVVPSREERRTDTAERTAPVARAKPSRDGRGGSFLAATAGAAVVGLIAGAIGLGAILVAIAASIFGAVLICGGLLLVPLSWVAGIFGFARPDIRLPVIDWWRRRR